MTQFKANGSEELGRFDQISDAQHLHNEDLSFVPHIDHRDLYLPQCRKKSPSNKFDNEIFPFFQSTQIHNVL